MKQKSGGPTLSPVPGRQLDLTAAVGPPSELDQGNAILPDSSPARRPRSEEEFKRSASQLHQDKHEPQTPISRRPLPVFLQEGVVLPKELQQALSPGAWGAGTLGWWHWTQG